MSSDKKNPEAEYFARVDHEHKQALADQLAAERAQDERAALQRLHAGHCGRCGATLEVKPFRGVQIDVCTQCGAVLLDPGELEQLAGVDKTAVIHSIAELFAGPARRGGAPR
jgi:hypothetical protein